MVVIKFNIKLREGVIKTNKQTNKQMNRDFETLSLAKNREAETPSYKKSKETESKSWIHYSLMGSEDKCITFNKEKQFYM